MYYAGGMDDVVFPIVNELRPDPQGHNRACVKSVRAARAAASGDASGAQAHPLGPGHRGPRAQPAAINMETRGVASVRADAAEARAAAAESKLATVEDTLATAEESLAKYKRERDSARKAATRRAAAVAAIKGLKAELACVQGEVQAARERVADVEARRDLWADAHKGQREAKLVHANARIAALERTLAEGAAAQAELMERVASLEGERGEAAAQLELAKVAAAAAAARDDAEWDGQAGTLVRLVPLREGATYSAAAIEGVQRMLVDTGISLNKANAVFLAVARLLVRRLDGVEYDGDELLELMKVMSRTTLQRHQAELGVAATRRAVGGLDPERPHTAACDEGGTGKHARLHLILAGPRAPAIGGSVVAFAGMISMAGKTGSIIAATVTARSRQLGRDPVNLWLLTSDSTSSLTSPRVGAVRCLRDLKCAELGARMAAGQVTHPGVNMFAHPFRGAAATLVTTASTTATTSSRLLVPIEVEHLPDLSHIGKNAEIHGLREFGLFDFPSIFGGGRGVKKMLLSMGKLLSSPMARDLVEHHHYLRMGEDAAKLVEIPGEINHRLLIVPVLASALVDFGRDIKTVAEEINEAHCNGRWSAASSSQHLLWRDVAAFASDERMDVICRVINLTSSWQYKLYTECQVRGGLALNRAATLVETIARDMAFDIESIHFQLPISMRSLWGVGAAGARAGAVAMLSITWD